MLRFTVNKNDLKEYEEKLPVDDIFYSGDKIFLKTLKPHGLTTGDYINFKRVKIDGTTLYDEGISVKTIDKNTFSIDSFKKLPLSATSCEIIDVFSPLKNDNIKAVKIVLAEPSYIITNRDVVTNSTIPNEVNTPTSKRRCIGDLVNYNNIFLLKATKIEENKYIEYEDVYYNTVESVNFKLNNINININVLIPLTYDGLDDTSVLYWFLNEKEEFYAHVIYKNLQNGILSYNDTRFLKEEDKKLTYRTDFSGKTDSYIYQIKNMLDVDFQIKDKFDVTLLKNDYYKDFYIEDKINENINNIVDMEKQIFIPKLEKLDSNCLVNEIKINVNIRERNNGWSSTQLANTWYGQEDGENTRITHIGFDEDDIKYQKSALKKSFLRLSFYDTPHRGNQKLLYYSTVFLDTNKIFNEFFNKNEKSYLEFTIKNSFDYFSCSEGYYLYLFPKLAKKDIPTTIYMKVEFNHAKYGKTLALVLPSDDKYKTGYIEESPVGTKGIEKLFNDLYIKINIMYDSINNKYVWYIPDITNAGGSVIKKINDYEDKRIIMTLYEPIVNEI